MPVKKPDVDSDKNLWKLVKKGNELAFNQLFDRYWESLTARAFKVLKNRESAQDVVQELFANLWLKRSSLEIDHMASYLSGAIKFRTLNHISKQKMSMVELDFVESFLSLNTPEDLLAFQELDNSVREAINQLPDQCQRIFKMSRFDHMSNKEIAGKLNLSVSTVENHISNAIRLLRPKVTTTISLFLLTPFVYQVLQDTG